jgi:hypothetical protein
MCVLTYCRARCLQSSARQSSILRPFAGHREPRPRRQPYSCDPHCWTKRAPGSHALGLRFQLLRKPRLRRALYNMTAARPRITLELEAESRSYSQPRLRAPSAAPQSRNRKANFRSISSCSSLAMLEPECGATINWNFSKVPAKLK